MDLLAHLEGFVAVAELGSFSRAAEQLGIAQPLLSRRIKNLERVMGDELFDRGPRQIRVTEFALLLLPHAQDVLSRVGHLRELAESARGAALHRLGVPPGCEPAALARIIRAASERQVAVSLEELPARARAAALSQGTLSSALLRVPVELAAVIVPLGFASAQPLSAARLGRSLHLDSLRPPRGAARDQSPSLLVVPEDDVGVFIERLHRSLAAAGVAVNRVRVTASAAAAAAEALAGTNLLLCDEPFARRHGLAWTPLADQAVQRGYELAFGPGRFGTPGADLESDWLVALLGAAVHAVGPTAVFAQDAQTLLTAQA